MGRRRITAGLAVATLLCACPPAGEGRKADKGYSQAQPIIDALARYHEEHERYPETLRALVPDYLPSIPSAPQDSDFQYTSAGSNYELVFVYGGPGINHCLYRPGPGQWSCGGYY